MKRRTIVITAVWAVLALAVGVVLARYVGDVALAPYALFLGAVLLALMLRRLRTLLPPAVPFERFFSRSKSRPDRVDQLHTVERDIRMSMSSGHDLHHRLRPMVHEIVSTRLSRGYGIDLDHETERAEAVIGSGKVWELIRPDREEPTDWQSGGWSRGDMEQLVDELERL
ncbi:MAG: hypothetical protein JW990_09635 [Thermoleophilia bacterium]|nr:hypothetical protein [Thermoleophilia bacterium]